MDESLLKILACPACKSSVVKINEAIVCRECGKIYPIKNGIPIMLIKETSTNEKEK
jgi:uncharacterized protein